MGRPKALADGDYRAMAALLHDLYSIRVHAPKGIRKGPRANFLRAMWYLRLTESEVPSVLLLHPSLASDVAPLRRGCLERRPSRRR
jgi:hypothetical protein